MVKRAFLLTLFSFLSIFSMDFTDRAVSVATGQTGAIFDSNEQDEPFFSSWKSLCGQLPKYCDEGEVGHTVLTKDTIEAHVNAFLITSREPDSLLTKKENWLAGKRPPIDFFNPLKNIFIPYVQKLVIPAGSIVSFHGDLHGDIHSLNEYFTGLIKRGYLNDQLEIIKDNFYMVFLGDYTDRGWYGAEVVCTILSLKCSNPEKVILVRGNHEDAYMNQSYGFEDNLRVKFLHKCTNESEFQNFANRIYRIYNYMPVALYIGCPDTQGNINFLQCCHGGLEIGFDPKPLLAFEKNCIFQLLGELKRCNQLAHLQEFKDDFMQTFWQHGHEMHNFTPESPRGSNSGKVPAIGFMWYDFIVQNKQNVLFNPNRGWYCGKDLTKAILDLHSTDKHKVRGVFRAHQHSTTPADPMMKLILNKDHKVPPEDTGVGKLWINKDQKLIPSQLWDGIVCTFCVSPCTPYGQKNSNDFSYDAFGLLKMSPKFEDWQLQVIRQEMLNKNDK